MFSFTIVSCFFFFFATNYLNLSNLLQGYLFRYPRVDITYSADATVTRRDDNVYRRDSINIKYCFVLELPQKMAHKARIEMVDLIVMP